MGNDAYPEYFRRRPIGRAPSPPTWACYEQIPYDDDYSDSGSEGHSCSEDEEDYRRAVRDSDDSEGDSPLVRPGERAQPEPRADGDMEIDERDEALAADKLAEYKKDVKGKQRAIDPEPESPKRHHHKKRRQPVITLRPILTIQRSQGFVWNQVGTFRRSPALVPDLLCRTCLCRRTLKTDVRSLCHHSIACAHGLLLDSFVANRCRIDVAVEFSGVHPLVLVV